MLRWFGVRIVSLIPILLLGALLLGARTQGFDRGLRDLGEVPAGQDGPLDDGQVDDDAGVVPQAPLGAAAGVEGRGRLAYAPADALPGRLFVSQIFRPPIA